MEIHRLSVDDWQRLKQLRLAALSDAPQAFGSTLVGAERYSAADWRKQIEELATFVAVSEKKDIGIVRGAVDDSEANNAFLISMWVAPDSRGLGAGKQLIGAVISWARDAGFTRLKLDVADDNSPAIALYERMKFLPTGETGSLPLPRTHVLEHRRALEL